MVRGVVVAALATRKASDFGRVYNGPCDDLPHGPCGLQAFGGHAQQTYLLPNPFYRIP